MKQHKVDWGPGYRMFKCDNCNREWKEPSRDCTSPSGECCPECNEFTSPHEYEEHYEWETDRSGNLI
jgi:hypothetical protein